MGNTRGNTIDINGKRYDAVTGTFLGAGTAPVTSGKKAGTNIDGFRRPSRSSKIAVRPMTATPVAAPKPKTVHSPAAHIKPHQPQKGKTLMRTAVKKPEIVAPSRIKAQTRTDVLARVPVQTVAPKLSHTSINPKRLRNATLASQSPTVSRFAAERQISTASRTYYDFAPAAPRVQSQQAAPQIAVTPVRSHAHRQDIFEQAIAKSTSHENTYEGKSPKRRNRWAGAATFTMAVLLLAGLVGYMNLPILSMKVAASRAGVAARMPGYSPAGFSFGSLSYGPGNVTISYTAGESSDRKFDITQKVSDWDSQALLTNFVASANKAYQTYERAGRTIYFYGNNTATWVDGGIWYTVNGNNSLSKNQLLDMAGSL